MTQLEMIPTEELVRELFGRKTFAGVLIYSPENHKRDGQVHRRFNLLTTTNNEQAKILLERGIDSLNNCVTEDET